MTRCTRSVQTGLARAAGVDEPVDDGVNERATFSLGALRAGGHGLPVDRGAAQRWFRAAAEHGHGHAQMTLGRYLMSGAAGDLDPAEGRKWLERAAAQGIAAEQDLAAAPAMAAS
jgi:TPR repeat protein